MPHRVAEDALGREGPLLFLCGRPERARRGMEAALASLLDAGADAGELLPRVVSGDARPTCLSRVALGHVYAALGRSLAEWPRWARYVRALEPRLLALAGLSPDALADDPALAGPFVARLEAERDRRLGCGAVSRGTADLVETPGEVSAAHARLRSLFARAEWDEWAAGIDSELARHFPFLWVRRQKGGNVRTGFPM